MTAQWDRKEHWEQVHQYKAEQEVSWFQEKPEISLALIARTGIGPDAAIIDIGGGQSRLAAYLQQSGFRDLSVLDVSETALEKASRQPGLNADAVALICADITAYTPRRTYDLWHDRATFHFLTGEQERQHYRRIATEHIRPGGFLLIGTFSPEGPPKCSGITVQRYDAAALAAFWKADFELIYSCSTAHRTPMNTLQHFTFCYFKRKP